MSIHYGCTESFKDFQFGEGANIELTLALFALIEATE